MVTFAEHGQNNEACKTGQVLLSYTRILDDLHRSSDPRLTDLVLAVYANAMD